MKKLFLLLTMMFTLSLSASAQIMDKDAEVKSDEAMCKLFEAKAVDYKRTMRDDQYAKATLKSYELRAKQYCDTAK